MQMQSLAFDISHTLAGGLVLISLMMLYQDRLYSLLNVFAPWRIALLGAGPLAYAIGAGVYVFKLAVAGFFLALFESATAKMRVFRVPQFLGAALMLGLLGTLLLFVSRSF